MPAKNQPGFNPRFTITPALASALMRIEAARQAILTLPMTPSVLAHLRETARLFSTHYSTMIEGNRLTQQEVAKVIGSGEHFPGRERDENEVKGYFAALDELERLANRHERITETAVQRLHALAMGGGRRRVRPTPYRDGQNVIRDSATGTIVYMPPEANDVPALMSALLAWLNRDDELPAPIRAAIGHYQFATIHPYYDGNGRTARLLATLILHLNGYGLNGLYALEEYYARDLMTYYRALSIGPSHNYYLGRAEADITGWVSYFVDGMAGSFEKVHAQASREATEGRRDHSRLIRNLDARQRRALELFRVSREITARDIAALFGFKQRTAARLCQQWTESGFIEIADPAKKSRRYRLGPPYEEIVSGLD